MKKLMLFRLLMMGGLAFTATSTMASENNEKKSGGKGATSIVQLESLQLKEAKIIEEFLKEPQFSVDQEPQKVKIYNTKGELLFEGNVGDENTKLYLLSANFILETSGVSIYLKEK